MQIQTMFLKNVYMDNKRKQDGKALDAALPPGGRDRSLPDIRVQGMAKARSLFKTRARARERRKGLSWARGSQFKRKVKKHLQDLLRTMQVRAKCSLQNPPGPQPMPALLIGHHYHLQRHRLLRQQPNKP